MKTLFVSDLDGTLLMSDVKLSDNTKKSLCKLLDMGVNFTIATARSPYSVNSLFADIPIKIPCILMNGVIIYDLCNKHFAEVESINKVAYDKVLSIIRSFRLSAFVYVVDDDKLISYYENITTPQMQSFFEERKKKYGKSFVQTESLSNIPADKAVYFTMLYPREELESLCKALDLVKDISYACYEDIYSDGLWYLEIFSKNATKYNATLKLKKMYGFDRVIGYGDSHNDLPLLEACDEFYAVSNATQELKSRATAVIGDNNSDSVTKDIQMRIK